MCGRQVLDRQPEPCVLILRRCSPIPAAGGRDQFPRRASVNSDRYLSTMAVTAGAW
ncbi:hypothetical protein D3C87_1839280 [compost metagenome]